ncbi:hypothetical protein [Egicoccus halophilus]|uniref:DUF3618 domain-containing protein n=1 Tax=Egicoccus halophilus TaxID=1670830 RepID=A0A8J3AAM8_9ACTN|nr:hypothetical protein [Egicoccus halophilus]GGI09269.1 hypothetical protein GCM10011354_33240 [Egicoccus halophilus]
MSAGDAAQRVKRQVQDGVAKAQHEFEAAKAEAQRVNERAQLPPAEDADDALRQVRELRESIDRDLATLEARVPPRDTLIGQARAVGGAAVGGLGLIGAISTLQQQRKQKKKFEREADRMARAVASHLPAAVAEVSPPVRPRVVEPDDGGGGGLGRKLAIVVLLASATFAVWSQLRNRADENDLWGPPPAPEAEGTVPPPTPASPPDTGPPPTPGSGTRLQTHAADTPNPPSGGSTASGEVSDGRPASP